MARWTTLNAAGSQGIPGPPGPGGGGTPAPNITAATESVFFQPDAGFGQNFGFFGVITLPTTDPNYSHLKTISVQAIYPDGHIVPFVYVNVPAVGTTVAYTGLVTSQPSTTETNWGIQFVCYNENGSPTASPYTLSSITVSAAGISSLSAQEVPGARYQDFKGGLHTEIEFTITVSGEQYPIYVSWWLDVDDGNGYQEQPAVTALNDAQTFVFGAPTSQTDGTQQAGSIWVPTVASQTSWKIAAVAGAVASQLPPAGATVATFTVVAANVPSATVLTNAHAETNPQTGGTIDYALWGTGTYTWNYYALAWDMPSTVADPDLFYCLLTVQKGYSATGIGTLAGDGITFTVSGTLTPGTLFDSTMVGFVVHVAGIWNTISSVTNSTTIVLANSGTPGSSLAFEIWVRALLVPGTTVADYEGSNEDPDLEYYGRQVIQVTPTDSPSEAQVFGDTPPDWTFPLAKNPDGSTNLYRTFRFLLYAVSRLEANPANATPGTKTLQSAWPGGLDYFDMTPSPQPHALDLTQTNPNTLAPAGVLGQDPQSRLQVNVAAPLFANLSNQLALQTSTDFVVNSGQLTVAAVNLAKAVNFNTTDFTISAGAFLVNAIAVNKLIAGTALFTGTATFAYSGKGELQIGSAGITIVDSYASPQNTLAVSSTGITVSGGSYSVAVSSVEVLLTGASGNMQFNSSGIVISNGTSQATLTASYVNIASGSNSLNLSASGVQINSPTAYCILTSTDFQIFNPNFSAVTPIFDFNTSSTVATLSGQGSNGTFTLTGTSTLCELNLGASGNSILAEVSSVGGTTLKMTALPSSNPGVGSKQFWYDPTDSNRVKYAP